MILGSSARFRWRRGHNRDGGRILGEHFPGHRLPVGSESNLQEHPGLRRVHTGHLQQGQVDLRTIIGLLLRHPLPNRSEVFRDPIPVGYFRLHGRTKTPGRSSLQEKGGTRKVYFSGNGIGLLSGRGIPPEIRPEAGLWCVWVLNKR